MIRLQPLGPDLARRIAQSEPQDEIAPEALTQEIKEIAAAHHRLYQKTGALLTSLPLQREASVT
jgi:hypothetical protein